MKRLMFILFLLISVSSFSLTKNKVPDEVKLHVMKLIKMSMDSEGEKSLSNNCSIGGSGCSFDSDCCSDNCFGSICQAGWDGKTYAGGNCTFDSDCLSDNCHGGECTGGNGCTEVGGCTFDSDCCSGNCSGGSCGQSCVRNRSYCTMDAECCSGNCSNNVCRRSRNDDGC